MKNIIKILTIALIALNFNQVSAQSDELVNVCALGIGNATYLKDYKVKLPANAPAQKFNLILNKGTVYKLMVCNADGYEGKAVIKLMDGNTEIGTNLQPDGSFAEAIGFVCQKTGMYFITCNFKNNKEGAAVIITSYVTK